MELPANKSSHSRLTKHSFRVDKGEGRLKTITSISHAVGLGYGQFTGRIALPIRSFFLEVSTLLTMTTVATINRLATMAGRYALLSRDPYSNE